MEVGSVCGLDRPAARRRREICPRRRAPAVFTGEKRRLALAAYGFQETRLSTLCISYPVRKTCKSNKPPLSSDTKDILGGVVVSTRRQKNAPRPRRGTHSFARVRPSRPSADPLGSHAARHDRCVTREVGRTRALTRLANPVPARDAREICFCRGAGSPPAARRGPRAGETGEVGERARDSHPLAGVRFGADRFDRPPVTLPRAARARAGTPASSLSGRSAFSLSSRVRSRPVSPPHVAPSPPARRH